MRGVAALVGASVPVAAVAASLKAGDDSELLNLCRKWHNHRRQIDRIGKEKNLLHDEAMAYFGLAPTGRLICIYR